MFHLLLFSVDIFCFNFDYLKKILMAVGNKTEKQMVVKSIEMLSGSTPVQDMGSHLIGRYLFVVVLKLGGF